MQQPVFHVQPLAMPWICLTVRSGARTVHGPEYVEVSEVATFADLMVKHVPTNCLGGEVSCKIGNTKGKEPFRTVPMDAASPAAMYFINNMGASEVVFLVQEPMPVPAPQNAFDVLRSGAKQLHKQTTAPVLSVTDVKTCKDELHNDVLDHCLYLSPDLKRAGGPTEARAFIELLRDVFWMLDPHTDQLRRRGHLPHVAFEGIYNHVYNDWRRKKIGQGTLDQGAVQLAADQLFGALIQPWFNDTQHDQLREVVEVTAVNLLNQAEEMDQNTKAQACRRDSLSVGPSAKVRHLY